MKATFSRISGLMNFSIMMLIPALMFAQTTQIAFQGFEGSGGDTWGIVAGSGNISNATGSGDTPANQRIRTGTKSWQVNNANAILKLENISTANYDSIQLTLKLSCPSVNADNGSESSDSVNVFVGLNDNPYMTTPDLTVNGNTNARWGYNATLIASSEAGIPVVFTAPQGGTSTNNYATILITIPDGTNSISIKIQTRNNAANELWCIDDISLTGVPAISGPTIYQPVSPQNFSTTTGIPDTNLVNVLFSSLESGLYASVSGTHASLFTVIPDSITASTPSPYAFKVIYLPNTTGAHTATLTLSSLDATSRTVTLNGATLATEPSAQPTNLNFTNVGDNSFTVNYTAAAGSPSGYIAVRKTNSAPSSNPVDGAFYTAGNTIGDGTVAYVGSDVTFNQTGLNPGTTYYYKIYSYNGSGNGTNYLTASPLSGSQLTTGAGGETIFPGVYGDSLLARLVTNYKTSTTLGYNGARDKMYGIIDNHNDTVTCVYGGYRAFIPYNDPNPRTWANNAGINCEHTYPQSLFGESAMPKSDLHHLYPTYDDINNARGDNRFNEIPDNLTAKWWRGTSFITTIPASNIHEYSESRTDDFEPREDHKGNVARSMFYLYTMYKNICDIYDPNFLHIQKNVLRQWHYYDPVDAAEETRNNAIATYQQNKKNPFILDSTLIRRAYFPPVIGIGEHNPVVAGDFTLYQNYPNPFNPSTVISYQLAVNSNVTLKIYNTLGQEIITLTDQRLRPGTYSVQWNGRDKNNRPVSSGVYLYRLKTDNQTEIKKLILLK